VQAESHVGLMIHVVVVTLLVEDMGFGMENSQSTLDDDFEWCMKDMSDFEEGESIAGGHIAEEEVGSRVSLDSRLTDTLAR
jgi:hypothetical protein